MSFYLSLVLLLHQDQVCYHPYTNGISSNTVDVQQWGGIQFGVVAMLQGR